MAARNSRSSLPLESCALAATAAPLYFEPALCERYPPGGGGGADAASEGREVFVDGGVVAPNPLLDAITHTQEALGHDAVVDVVSVGAGALEFTQARGGVERKGGHLSVLCCSLTRPSPLMPRQLRHSHAEVAGWGAAWALRLFGVLFGAVPDLTHRQAPPLPAGQGVRPAVPQVLDAQFVEQPFQPCSTLLLRD